MCGSEAGGLPLRSRGRAGPEALGRWRPGGLGLRAAAASRSASGQRPSAPGRTLDPTPPSRAPVWPPHHPRSRPGRPRSRPAPTVATGGGLRAERAVAGHAGPQVMLPHDPQRPAAEGPQEQHFLPLLQHGGSARPGRAPLPERPARPSGGSGAAPAEARPRLGARPLAAQAWPTRGSRPAGRPSRRLPEARGAPKAQWAPSGCWGQGARGTGAKAGQAGSPQSRLSFPPPHDCPGAERSGKHPKNFREITIIYAN